MQFQKLCVAIGTATAGLLAIPVVASAFSINSTGTTPTYSTVISEGVAQYGDAQVTKPNKVTGLPVTVYETTLTNASKNGVAVPGGQAAWSGTPNAPYTVTFQYNTAAKVAGVVTPQIIFSVKAPKGVIYKSATTLSALYNYASNPFDGIDFGLTADAGQSVSFTPTLLTTYSPITGKAVKTTLNTLYSNTGSGSTQFFNLGLAGDPNFGGSGGRFSLTGTLAYNITGATSTRPNFNIRVGKVVPTPALLPAIIGFGAAALRKKSKAAHSA